MATEIERLQVRLEANAVQFESQMKRINKALYGSQAETRKTLDRIKRDFKDTGRDLHRSLVIPVQTAAALATGAMIAFSYNAAKRAEAVQGAFEQTFRDMPDEANKAVAAISGEFHRLETDIKDNFTQLRSVMTALGVDAEQSLKIVDDLQRRSLDIAAFRNVSDAEAFRAVISGITGETEPLKRFGIVVNETAVKAELMRLGFKGNATGASEAAKSIARTNIIMRQSAEMQGQVAREADTLAEQEKRVRTEFTKTAEDFGKQFLPVAAKVLTWATDALKAFNDLPSGTQNAGLAMLALVAASGPISMVIGGLTNLVKAAIAARIAIAAIPSVKGAAGQGLLGGVAGGVAGRAGLGAVLTGVATSPAAAATLPLALSGDTNQKALQGQERVNAQLREEARVRGRIAELTREGSTAEAQRQSAYLSRIEANRKAGQAAVIAADPATAAVAEAKKAAAEIQAALGGFGLSEDQKSPVSGDKPKGASGAKAEEAAAARRAEAQEDLTLQRAVDYARATGNEAAVKAAEERQTLAQLTAQYEQAGYADAKSRATEHLAYINTAAAAEEEINLILEGRQRQIERQADHERQTNDMLLDRLSYEADLAGLRGDPVAAAAAERRLWIETRINELLSQQAGLTREAARAQAGTEAAEREGATRQGESADRARSMARDFTDVLASDNWAEAAGRKFREAAFDNLEDLLTNLFSGLTGGNGAGGNSIGAIIGSALKGMIPGFASGTNSAPGGLSYVHKGEVLTNLPKGTSVIPAHAVRAMGALAGRSQVQPRAAAQTPIVRIYMDEGGLFAPRVQQLSGQVAVQTTATGVAYAQDQTLQTAKRRRQSFIR